MMLNTQKVEFVRSAARRQDFPRDGLPQVAFAGRSNVGKSSVINRLLNRKNFARVGASPGKTTRINYFLVDEKLYLVDLPGYGYARVSRAEKENWARLIQSWFDETGLMTFGVQVVDVRHTPAANDVSMCDYFKQSGRAFVVLANKLDKVKKSDIPEKLSVIRETLELPDTVALVPFSAEKGTGREELVRRITECVPC